jgi:hypothetical protein
LEGVQRRSQKYFIVGGQQRRKSVECRCRFRTGCAQGPAGGNRLQRVTRREMFRHGGDRRRILRDRTDAQVFCQVAPAVIYRRQQRFADRVGRQRQIQARPAKGAGGCQLCTAVSVGEQTHEVGDQLAAIGRRQRREPR